MLFRAAVPTEAACPGTTRAEKRHRPIQVIDFETPSNNDFVVTWEWKIEPLARKGNRADVMFVVNGLPVAIVEHKNPKDGGALDRAVKQLRRYEKETPELLAAPQLFNVTHLLDYWYGVTWNANRRYISKWKQTPDEEYRFAVQAFFEPTDFLRTLEDWILFYIEDGETRKSVLREHQRRAIDKIVARCADASELRGMGVERLFDDRAEHRRGRRHSRGRDASGDHWGIRRFDIRTIDVRRAEVFHEVAPSQVGRSPAPRPHIVRPRQISRWRRLPARPTTS